MLNRALNIPGFLRCVPEKKKRIDLLYCLLTLCATYYVNNSVLMYYVLILFLINFSI